MNAGIENMIYARKERRIKVRLQRRNMALIERVPMWRLLSVVMLAFATPFFAFCAMIRENRMHHVLVDRVKGVIGTLTCNSTACPRYCTLQYLVKCCLVDLRSEVGESIEEMQQG